LRPLKVLLAEDGLVNQTVARRLLEKYGHSVTVVGDGLDALETLEIGTFDVVLMDIQMPGLDGFAATAEIRRREAGTGRHTPVVAMTAHAMKGDRELCIGAGMDGYITKPIRFSDIEQTLAGLANPSVPPTKPMTKAASWNKTEALDRIGGDEVLLRDLCHIFLEESPKLLQKLQQAVAAGDSDGVMRAAHSLKGESSYLGAGGTSEAARQLEQMGRNQDLSCAANTLAVLQREVASLHLDLEDLAGVHRE
jgi:CheY-like chemotaxis protein